MPKFGGIFIKIEIICFSIFICWLFFLRLRVYRITIVEEGNQSQLKGAVWYIFESNHPPPPGCTLPMGSATILQPLRMLPRTNYGHRTDPMEMGTQSGSPQDSEGLNQKTLLPHGDGESMRTSTGHQGASRTQEDHRRTSLDIEGPERRTPGFGLPGPKTPGLEDFGISGFPGTRASNFEV